MDVQVTLSNGDDAYIIKNLYPLYLHDLSEFNGDVPNEHGILEPNSPTVRNLVEHGEVFKGWWEKPNIFFPFLILVDGRPAGFCFTVALPRTEKGIEFRLQEFFLLHPYRSKGIGEIAATQILDRFRGQWDLHVIPSNKRARAFWRKMIATYTSGQFQEEIRSVVGEGDMVIFSFNNTSRT